MATPRQRRTVAKSKGKEAGVKLNITSMMDMFTIILVFLLKSYSTEGQLVTPARGLLLPNSTVELPAKQGLELKVSEDNVMIEELVVLNKEEMVIAVGQTEFLIDPLLVKLKRYHKKAKAAAKAFGQQFKGSITIQGDKDIPYNLLVKLMYTCGQAGFPNINLIVYKGE